MCASWGADLGQRARINCFKEFFKVPTVGRSPCVGVDVAIVFAGFEHFVLQPLPNVFGCDAQLNGEG